MIDKRDFWVRDKNTDLIFHICEGTGDNLLPEDTEAGYIDYIYYNTYETLEDAYNEINEGGGMVLLDVWYKDLTLGEIIEKTFNMEDLECNDYEIIEVEIWEKLAKYQKYVSKLQSI